MATLTAQQITASGLNPTYSAADAGGDDFVNTGGEFFHIKNGDGSEHTPTFVTTVTVAGFAVDNNDVAVPAGEERIVGPFPTSIYSGTVSVTYDAVTSVTVAVLKK